MANEDWECKLNYIAAWNECAKFPVGKQIYKQEWPHLASRAASQLIAFKTGSKPVQDYCSIHNLQVSEVECHQAYFQTGNSV